ncbi:unnamed protein product [Ambrosiozyma monospora]|uniref:Unnamed protein product n=1 Tax=Ambrosiozyma monospora TaxID=43982 RepID=A0A9W6YWA7_AMBMO|nr:unnamed protein product [Ambrosiozyma monospora]
MATKITRSKGISFKPRKLSIEKDLTTPVFSTPCKWTKHDKCLSQYEKIQTYPKLRDYTPFTSLITENPSRMCIMSRVKVPRMFLNRLEIVNDISYPNEVEKKKKKSSESSNRSVLIASEKHSTGNLLDLIAYYPNSLNLLCRLNETDGKGDNETFKLKQLFPKNNTRIFNERPSFLKKTKDVFYRIKLDKVQSELKKIQDTDVDLAATNELTYAELLFLFESEPNSRRLYSVETNETGLLKIYLNMPILFRGEPAFYELLKTKLNPELKDVVSFSLTESTTGFYQSLMNFAIFMETSLISDQL